MTRLYATISGDDWWERHGADFVAIHAEDVVVEARTAAGERYRVVGRDAAMEEARSLYDVGLHGVTVTPVEVRGDDLALILFTNYAEETGHGGGAAVVEQLCVCRANTDGLISLVVIYEDTDMALAVRHLDELDRES